MYTQKRLNPNEEPLAVIVRTALGETRICGSLGYRYESLAHPFFDFFLDKLPSAKEK